MRVGIPKNINQQETRISIMPETVKKYVDLGIEVVVEAGIGTHLHIDDEVFSGCGANIVNKAKDIVENVDIVLSIALKDKKLIKLYAENTWHISFFNPFTQAELLPVLINHNINLISLELLPRTTIAQPMDALSSQSNLAGYASVLQACQHSQKVLPMMMTAAGTIAPAKVFILGVGVAGLQAIATAKRLGAQVTAFDVRPTVEEQVRSLGAKFLKIDVGETGQTQQGYAKALTPAQLEKQQLMMLDACAQSDIIITTALIFGKPAPKLITEAMLKKLKPGTVIVDMATEAGGNVDHSSKDEIVDYEQVKIIGISQLARTVPLDASRMYANNIFNLIHFFWDKEHKKMRWDFEDEILQSALLTHDGVIVHPNFKTQEQANG